MLGRRIGRGGMGQVFAALRPGAFGIAQVVALKTMTSGLAEDPAAREAFLREARILARLAHPNVVRWLDAGEIGEEVYIAMELLHGASLAALLAASREPVPPPIAIAILLDLARGLHAAHELCDDAGRPLSLVHQDVSPQNVIVGYDGRTRLVDFGVARLASVDASRADTARGKPAYLAPEQIEGRGLDRRADVFALGVVAFELLTGRRLFARASIAETHAAVLFDPIPDLAAMRAAPAAASEAGAGGHDALPAGVCAAVVRALARRGDERWPTADAFRRALALARDEAGLPDVDGAELGAFARARVPPPWMPEQLFAEIQGAIVAGGEAAPDEISQAATVTPRRRPPAQRAPSRGIARFPGRSMHMPHATASGASPWPRGRPAWLWGGAAALGASLILIAVSARRQPRAGVLGSEPAAQHVSELPPLPSSAVPESGWISVWSTPWGTVRIDDRPVGDSPAVRVVVPAGPHTVTVESDAGEQSQSVVVKGGEESRVRFVF